MTKRRLIALEFNELCPSLIDRFIDQGCLPNFKKLKDQSIVYTTDAQEKQENLEPWIQWVTVHCGVLSNEHQIFNLGEASKLTHPSIWDLVSDSGQQIWVCGSMNVRPDAKLNGCVLPDAWSADTPVLPEELAPFFKFVKTNVQEHTNSNLPLKNIDYIEMIIFLLKRGLSYNTVKTIVFQLVKEQLSKISFLKKHFRFAAKWKRAVILDKILWDVFAWYYKQNTPKFSTFFINSTAHFQHKFWRNMEPDKFEIKPSAEDQEQYQDAILFGYKEMDQIVGRCLALADSQTDIVFCSALSQQPYLLKEELGGKRFYRPHNLEKLVELLELQDIKKISPVMSEEFHLFFHQPSSTDSCQSQIAEITVAGTGLPTEALFKCKKEVTNKMADLLVGCRIHSEIPQDAVISIPAKGITFNFYDLFYQADSLKSGMHHPDGIFWIRTRNSQGRIAADKIPLVSVAPTLMKMMGFDPHPQMKAASVPFT